MKFATVVLLGILLLGSYAPLNAQPAGTSQVVLAFTGGSVYTSDTTGICMWYPVLVGDLPLQLLFSAPLFQPPVVDKEHAYFIWVSEFSSQVLPSNKNFNYLALVLEGEGTIYFTTRPDLRDWSDWTKRETWGEPVAKFGRKAGLFQSADGGMTGGMTNTAQLVSSHTFAIFGKSFNFARDPPRTASPAIAAAGKPRMPATRLNTLRSAATDGVQDSLSGFLSLSYAMGWRTSAPSSAPWPSRRMRANTNGADGRSPPAVSSP